MSKLRRNLYKGARILGDIEAVLSLNPKRIAKRLANKWIGRNVARRIYIK